MGVPTIDTSPFTIEEFQAFAERRPDEERWELIEGVPILNASASLLHQVVATNILVILKLAERQRNAPWMAVPGVNTVLSPISAPIPDILVRPRDRLTDWKCDDVIVAMEILSPSTARRDLTWKRGAYTSLLSLQAYLVVAQDTAEVVLFDRSKSFEEERFSGLDTEVPLRSIDLSLPLREVYRDCGF